MVSCVGCDSKRVIEIVKDWHWSDGGDIRACNKESCYKEEDLEFLNKNQLPDIAIYWCMECDRMWD